ncbi:DNA-3-methyladenine glycosylase I [Pseudomonadales bacterium]|nr:DNA-3-methyladenine glycosylase I [Pseudomonadales bacterium]MDB4430822.1 DNA-3-methyladenine glycosylase I [Pseudomonadales bacterium]MDC6464969.1 DNA-3-methyladenine glycosylase I [bacterium]
MVNYNSIYDLACLRKGSAEQVEVMLSKPKTKRQLKNIADATYLAEFSKKVFQSGFVWRVVEAKWDNFEELFWGFDIDKLLMMPDDMLERKSQDKKIIRNYKKIWAIRENAMFIDSVRRHYNISFAEFIAEWPVDDITGLWVYLKKNGTRLGGNIGPYALRSLGKDTFLMTRDVEGFLRKHKIIDTGVNTKSALHKSQSFFNDLQQESGRSIMELSRLVSYSHGDNVVGV